MKTLPKAEPGTKASRIYWTDNEWEDFVGAYLYLHPEHNPLAPDFKIRHDEFAATQRRAISSLRQRPIHNDVLDKAKKKTAPIFARLLQAGNTVDELEMVSKHIANWTDDELVLIANQLHVLRSDLNLMFADTPTGFSVEDFAEAQKAVPSSRRRRIENLEPLAAPLKKAYERIRAGNHEPTFIFSTPDEELISVRASEIGNAASRRRITWKADDFYKLAKELHRSNPKAGYINDASLKEIRAPELFAAQNVALAFDRRRTLVQISQSMVKLRSDLAEQFAVLKKDLMENNFSALAGTVGKPVSNGVANESISVPIALAPAKEPSFRRAPSANGAPARTESGIQGQNFAQAPINLRQPQGISGGQSLSASTQFTAPEGNRSETASQSMMQQIFPSIAPSAPTQQSAASTQASSPPVGEMTQVVMQSMRPLLEAMAAEFAKVLAAAIAPQVADLLRKEGFAATTSSSALVSDAVASTVAQTTFKSSAITSAAPSVSITAEEQDRDDEDDKGFPNGNVALPVSLNDADDHLDEDPLDSLRLQDPNLHQSRLLETRIKLPTSPIEGRTTIGIVGVKHKQAMDLESKFPDVAFTCVDNTSHEIMHTLMRCAKVIGVTGFVPPMADQLLEKTLRARYERISGGIPSVEKQLSQWLRSGVISTPLHA